MKEYRLGLFILCLITLSCPLMAANSDTEVDAFSRGLETQIQTKLNALSPETKVFLVSVSAVRNPFPKESAGSNAKENLLELGYAPLPLEGNPQGVQPIPLASLNVTIHVLDTIPPTLRQAAKEVVAAATMNLNPQIQFKQLDVPGIAPKSTPSLRKSYWESEFARYLMGLLPIPIASLLLLLGILIVGNMWRSTANKLMANVNVKGPGLSINAEGESESRGDLLPTSAGDPMDSIGVPPKLLEQRLLFIRHILEEAPKAFVRTLEQHESDIPGVRVLLPYLSGDQFEQLRQQLRPATINALVNSSMAEFREKDFGHWLEVFVQRLAMENLRGARAIEKILGENRIEHLRNAAQSTVVAAVKELDLAQDSAALRVLLEVLGTQVVGKLLSGSGSDSYLVLSQSAQLSEAQLVEAADKILHTIHHSQVLPQKIEGQEEYTVGLLTNLLVHAIRERSLPQADELFSKMVTASPQLEPILLRQVWVPSCLSRMPEHDLAEFVRRIPMEDKVSLLIGLPTPQSKLIERLLPQGKVRLIIADEVKKAETGMHADLAPEVCRDYLEELRKLSLKNNWKLKPFHPETQEANQMILLDSDRKSA